MEEEFIIEVLDLFKSKLKNKKCTKQQTDAVYRIMTENLDIFATADEIAQHYGKRAAGAVASLFGEVATPFLSALQK